MNKYIVQTLKRPDLYGTLSSTYQYDTEEVLADDIEIHNHVLVFKRRFMIYQAMNNWSRVTKVENNG